MKIMRESAKGFTLILCIIIIMAAILPYEFEVSIVESNIE